MFQRACLVFASATTNHGKQPQPRPLNQDARHLPMATDASRGAVFIFERTPRLYYPNTWGYNLRKSASEPRGRRRPLPPPPPPPDRPDPRGFAMQRLRGVVHVFRRGTDKDKELDPDGGSGGATTGPSGPQGSFPPNGRDNPCLWQMTPVNADAVGTDPWPLRCFIAPTTPPPPPSPNPPPPLGRPAPGGGQ